MFISEGVQKLEVVGEMIKKRLLYGLAMVILTAIVMGFGVVVFALLLGRNILDVLFGDRFLFFELLIVLAVLFVLGFFFCPNADKADKKGFKGLEIKEKELAVVIKTGPNYGAAIILSMIALAAVFSGVLGILNAMGIVNNVEGSSLESGIAGAVFSVVGLLFAYLTVGAITCWEMIEMSANESKICTVTFLRRNCETLSNGLISSLCLVKGYDNRYGDAIELRLEFNDRKPFVIASSQSYDALLEIQHRISSITRIPIREIQESK